MNRRVVIALGVVAVAAIAGILFLGGPGDSPGSETDETGATNITDTSNGTSQTPSDSSDSESESANETIERLQNTDPWGDLSNNTTPYEIEPVTGAEDFPPGVVETNANIDTILSTTIEQARTSSWASNFRIRGVGDVDQPWRHTSKYNFTGNRGLQFVAVRRGYGHRTYSTGENAVRQHIYGNGTTTQESRSRMAVEDYLRLDELRPYLAAGFFQPVNKSDVEGHRTFKLESQALTNERVLREHIGAADITAYGGHIWVGEEGRLLRADLLMRYTDRNGESYERRVTSSIQYGEVRIRTEEIDWVDNSILTQNVTREIELVQGRYLRISPQGQAIPGDSRVTLETEDSQYGAIIPEVRVNETAYLYLDDGELQFVTEEPDQPPLIGRDYRLLIAHDGRVILRKDTR